MDIVEQLRTESYVIPLAVQRKAADEIEGLRKALLAVPDRNAIIEECVRLALEKAIKLEMGGLSESGSRLNQTAYQWRTIANELRELAKQ